ncbi:MAG: AraC family transcriptional regulator, partial [Calditrichaeota bacterium]
KNFNTFINDYRIKEARHILANDRERRYTIEAVGEAVGFNSANAFYRAFKKFTGVTPSFFISQLSD